MFRWLYHRSYYVYYFWGWAVFILISYLIPNFTPDSLKIKELHFEIRLDYIAHFMVFFIWTFLFLIWKWPVLRTKRLMPVIVYGLAGFCFSASIEVLHLIIPDRTFNPMDMISNSSGFTAGLIFVIFISFNGRSGKWANFLKQFG